MAQLLNLLPFLAFLVPSLWLIWFLLTSLNRITRALEDIAITLRRLDGRSGSSRHA